MQENLFQDSRRKYTDQQKNEEARLCKGADWRAMATGKEKLTEGKEDYREQ